MRGFHNETVFVISFGDITNWHTAMPSEGGYPLHQFSVTKRLLPLKVPRWVEDHIMICQLQLGHGHGRRCGILFRRALPANDDYRCAKSDNGHHRP